MQFFQKKKSKTINTSKDRLCIPEVLFTSFDMLHIEKLKSGTKLPKSTVFQMIDESSEVLKKYNPTLQISIRLFALLHIYQLEAKKTNGKKRMHRPHKNGRNYSCLLTRVSPYSIHPLPGIS